MQNKPVLDVSLNNRKEEKNMNKNKSYCSGDWHRCSSRYYWLCCHHLSASVQTGTGAAMKYYYRDWIWQVVSALLISVVSDDEDPSC